ncbi:hypothetical protein CDL15_Pgr004694 [Punica granatum]|uniref:beta-galactosidase n=1 Tax=Punica granatum TaxID=22663 RepID=A0A218W7Y4_PUNGR|nr:hypothetical protein CDL15_Pgr004694 [Punica granatum]
MKDAKLFASQGGPIILSQIENEYNTIQLAFKEPGTRYIQGAGTMAVGLKMAAPWFMCRQKDAPDPVINTCNARNCGDTFTGQYKPNKPTLYRVFSDQPSQRAAEDLAFSVARFFSKNGSLANYYMYYGGTNYGRSGYSFVTTRYYDEAPIDEYGLLREPKWGHLRDLHHALRLCSKALLWGMPSVQMFGHGIEARIDEQPGTNVCAAFLSNNIPQTPMSVTFRGTKYFLSQHSISILPDCKTVVYNTKTIVAQHSSRSHENPNAENKNFQGQMFRERIPNFEDSPLKLNSPLELFSATKDTTDYLWYTTRPAIQESNQTALQVASLGHLMHAFVNGEYAGSLMKEVHMGATSQRAFSFGDPET